jgi:hypothetical protein
MRVNGYFQNCHHGHLLGQAGRGSGSWLERCGHGPRRGIVLLRIDPFGIWELIIGLDAPVLLVILVVLAALTFLLVRLILWMGRR